MAERKNATTPARSTGTGLNKEERAAMKERLREEKAQASKEEAAQALLQKISEMRPSDRAMAERIHALVLAHAPSLSPRTWYGMPAYAKGDDVVCFFRPAEKFNTRYATLGFSDEAKLDDGRMWPTDFALTGLTGADEARIAALLKKAVG